MLIGFLAGPQIYPQDHDQHSEHPDVSSLVCKFWVMIQARWRQTSSGKGLIVNSLVFASHTVSVAATQLCHYSTKAVKDNKQYLAAACLKLQPCLTGIIISPTPNPVLSKTHWMNGKVNVSQTIGNVFKKGCLDDQISIKERILTGKIQEVSKPPRRQGDH